MQQWYIQSIGLTDLIELQVQKVGNLNILERSQQDNVYLDVQ